MQRFAVLTSGGDAPGMNAAIRAVVREGIAHGFEVFGVTNGYAGLITDNIRPLTARDVGGILQQGGTFLGSARSLEFKTPEGREQALKHLRARHIEGLIVIGGNGSQTGAYALHQMGFPVNGVASTIDNDLYGSDITIGVDTALNIAVEAIDRLRVTASSHHRAFLVEVMGRDCGYLALMAGIAGGAEITVIPEVKITPEAISLALEEGYKRGKSHGLVVVAEGSEHDAEKLLGYFKQHPLGYDVRATTLGHIQRGGIPTAADRVLASRLGAGAASAFAEGKTGVLAGIINNQLAYTPLEVVVAHHKVLDPALIHLAQTLAL